MQVMSAELKAAQVRYTELDRIMKRLYEDSVSGRITSARFQKLSAEYETEQAEIEKQIESNQIEMAAIRQKTQDSSSWLGLIKEYANIQELDRIVLSELIDKITVGESKIINGEKRVDVTIYYRFVGAIHQNIIENL
jgi:site-specific DNA recombinase